MVLRSMTKGQFRVALGVVVLVAGALAMDRGVYVGSATYLMGAPIDPGLDFVQKRCRYLFATGVAEIDAEDGQMSVRLNKPAEGHCRLFAH